MPCNVLHSHRFEQYKTLPTLILCMTKRPNFPDTFWWLTKILATTIIYLANMVNYLSERALYALIMGLLYA